MESGWDVSPAAACGRGRCGRAVGLGLAVPEDVAGGPAARVDRPGERRAAGTDLLRRPGLDVGYVRLVCPDVARSAPGAPHSALVGGGAFHRGVDRRAALLQRQGPCGAAVRRERAQLRIAVLDVAWLFQATGVRALEVMPGRGDPAGAVVRVARAGRRRGRVCRENRVPQGYRPALAVDPSTGAARRAVAVQGDVGQLRRASERVEPG